MNDILRDALGRMIVRIDNTELLVGERFPLYADPATAEWVTTRRGSWVAGFWVGQLWLRASLAGERAHHSAAEEWTTRLKPGVSADTATRGLTFWYGAAAGSRLGLSAAGDAMARTAAAHLAETIDPGSGILPWGTGFGDPPDPIVARVDGLPGAVPLLAWAGAGPVADRYLRAMLAIGRTSSGPAAALELSAGRWRVRSEPPPGWSRGRAWLLLALADAGHWINAEFNSYADELLNAQSTPDPAAVPDAVLGAGTTPDTSAAAITAVALCKLGRLDQAVALTETLIAEHLSGAPRPGRLLNGCYDLPRKLAVEHELIWGNYFLLLALAILCGEIPATAV
ncbi:unsaturated chondroitin disaccharide hydrolase [Nocardia sp. GAS34]|uniref:hypothetical protein n=1 Tax=unclassified Nocardia TaxID=2637762 RepID=UPI003D1ED4E3